jgi:hypothetical protein
VTKEPTAPIPNDTCSGHCFTNDAAMQSPVTASPTMRSASVIASTIASPTAQAPVTAYATFSSKTKKHLTNDLFSFERCMMIPWGGIQLFDYFNAIVECVGTRALVQMLRTSTHTNSKNVQKLLPLRLQYHHDQACS